MINKKNKITILKKSNDLLSLSNGMLVTKRNLFDLIQYSKVVISKYWDGPKKIIGNTPQQGINWIGNFPNIKGVIIKTRPGSYEEDGWLDDDKNSYNYSFKSKKGIISLEEKANLVLLNQPKNQYPIILFTEFNKGNWCFEGEFFVDIIYKKNIILRRLKTSSTTNYKHNIVEEREYAYETNKRNTRKIKFLTTADELKNIFVNSFEYEKTFKYEQGNPFLIEFEAKKYYVYLKNISPAYYPKYPDITRIQLPFSTHFTKIAKSNIPFIILGYNSNHETFTGWDPAIIKNRLNNKSNVSLFSRDSFQEKLQINDFKEHKISNGDTVIIFNFKSTPQYIKNYIDYFKKQIDLFSEINLTENLKEKKSSKLKKTTIAIKKIELEVLDIYSKNPFLAQQKYNEYMSKFKSNKKEIIEGFDMLINKSE